MEHKEKVTKKAEIKKLQQKFQALHEQEWTRNEESAAHLSEATRDTCLIYPVKKRLQHITQILEAGLSEHINLDQVENLAMQVEEVTKEFSKVQQILKEFQDKVGPVQHPELEA